jgi:nucleoside-diphosphate kinase
MKSTKKIDENGYGYNTTMLPDYDGFIIIKPGFLKYTDIIIKDLHRHDFIVIEAKEKTLTKDEAEIIYSCHKGKPFFDKLIKYMTSGPCIGMILLSPYSDRESATETLKQLKEKYRKRYGIDKMHNVIHSSDSYQNAIHEAEAFFD